MKFFNRTTVFAAAAAMSLSACDSFLEKDPAGSLSSDTIFDDVSGAEAAIVGAYNRVQGPMDDMVIFSDLAGDFAVHTGSFPSWAEIQNHALPTSNPEAGGQWGGWYSLINQTNLILENVDGAEGIAPARANEIKGEAFAMRAYAYHNLARWFGGVPLVTAGAIDLENLDTPRASLADTYSFILNDLEQAAGLVSADRTVGFIDADVVKAIRARVLLYDGQFDAAGDLAAELYDKYPLASLESLYDGLNSSESIWELQYNVDDGNGMSFFAFVTGGRYEYGPSPQAQAAFNADGDRITYNLATDAESPIIAKYFRVNTDDDHHFLFRGGEMALIEAEAEARSGDAGAAITILNEIRTRAGEPVIGFGADEDGSGDSDGNGTFSGAEALDLVIAERAVELAYEGHRWHDLVRTGRAVSVLGLNSENDTLWPIPQGEIDRNTAVVQNPGY